MFPVESLRTRRSLETERRERIFNDKVRTIGVDVKALNLQVKEKQRLQEVEKEEQKAHDARMLHNSRVANLLHRREVKEKREMEKDTVDFRLHHQRTQRGEESDGEMMLPGLVGEDPDSEDRCRRQKEQLRDWLMQQQREQEEERNLQRMEDLQYDRSRVDVDGRALQLQSAEEARRKANAVATKEFNMAVMEEKRRLQGGRIDEVAAPTPGMLGAPGICPSSERRSSAHNLQQIIQVQMHQVEEKKRAELQEKTEQQILDRLRLDSARKAILIERQQAKLNKQQRRRLDSTNVQLAQTHRLQRADVDRGRIDETFFSQFNTCSR